MRPLGSSCDSTRWRSSSKSCAPVGWALPRWRMRSSRRRCVNSRQLSSACFRGSTGRSVRSGVSGPWPQVPGSRTRSPLCGRACLRWRHRPGSAMIPIRPPCPMKSRPFPGSRRALTRIWLCWRCGLPTTRNSQELWSSSSKPRAKRSKSSSRGCSDRFASSRPLPSRLERTTGRRQSGRRRLRGRSAKERWSRCRRRLHGRPMKGRWSRCRHRHRGRPAKGRWSRCRRRLHGRPAKERWSRCRRRHRGRPAKGRWSRCRRRHRGRPVKGRWSRCRPRHRGRPAKGRWSRCRHRTAGGRRRGDGADADAGTAGGR